MKNIRAAQVVLLWLSLPAVGHPSRSVSESKPPGKCLSEISSERPPSPSEMTLFLNSLLIGYSVFETPSRSVTLESSFANLRSDDRTIEFDALHVRYISGAPQLKSGCRAHYTLLQAEETGLWEVMVAAAGIGCEGYARVGLIHATPREIKFVSQQKLYADSPRDTLAGIITTTTHWWHAAPGKLVQSDERVTQMWDPAAQVFRHASTTRSQTTGN